MKKEKILIISDTHGDAYLLELVMEIEGQVDRVIHLGDREGEDDVIREITGQPLETVNGNCDRDPSWNQETLVPIGNHVAFLTHGHQYDVVYSTEELEWLAKVHGADIALYGHTHRPDYHVAENGVIVCNPGSLARPRQKDRKGTYVILTHYLDTDELDFKLKRI